MSQGTIPHAEATIKMDHLGMTLRVDIRIDQIILGVKPLDASKLPSLLKDYLETLERKDLE